NFPPIAGDAMKDRQNLAVVAPFEPGSVFKVITLATALETTRLTPKSSFHCGNGRMTLFRRVIHDAHPNGQLTMQQILAKSSNIGAIKIALEVGSSRLHEYLGKFGFGSKTGVPLPGEQRGTVHRLSRWIPSSIGSVAMGHEISTTTLQLAQACSVIANGGFLVKPKLVISRDRDGAIEKESSAVPERVLRPQVANTMRLMMERVVLEGTGKRARLDGYTSGGKTGSAQIYDAKARIYTHRYNGSYMGFAPINNPAIVVVITLNETPSGDRGFGGRVAAPVFREVATAALRLLEVQRDLPDELSPLQLDPSGDENDLAIAGLSVPPGEDEDGPSQAEAPPRFIGPELPPQLVGNGPKVPDFHGKSKRDVLSNPCRWAFALRLRVPESPGPNILLRASFFVRERG
ncbi:MAG: penicillin-binding protein 2, partial [Bryobacteraceae bacterium]